MLFARVISPLFLSWIFYSLTASAAESTDKFVPDLSPYSKTFTEMTSIADEKNKKEAAANAKKYIISHHDQLMRMNEIMVKYMADHQGHREAFTGAYNQQVTDIQQAWTFLDEVSTKPEECETDLRVSLHLGTPIADTEKPDPQNPYLKAAKTLELFCQLKTLPKIK